jgi:hypothetical protein
MPDFEKDEFKFPDETEVKVEIESDDGFEIEVEDDTPDEDKGREPMPKEIVEEIEKDELEEYSDNVKNRFKQLKKVYHDERRAKEEILREQQAALDVTKRLYEENRRIKSMLQNGEAEYANAIKGAAEAKMEIAKKAYKEAHEVGDADQMVAAQQAMMQIQMEIDRARNFKLPPLQEEKFEVQTQQEPVRPVQKPDDKAMAWQERNDWFGTNRSMTAYALGLHEELRDNGVPVGSDEYYSKLDKTMRKRFPEHFQSTLAEEETPKQEKPKNVVAAATRSTAPKKVRLTKSQVAISKKLGLTPEQYVKELLKMEN